MTIVTSYAVKPLLVFSFLVSIIYLSGCSEKKKENSPKNLFLSSSLKYQKVGELPFMGETRVIATIGDHDKPTGAFSGHAMEKPAPVSDQSFQIVVSELGNSVAYKAKRDDKQYVVINGKAGRPFKVVESILFSPDGQKFVYTGMDEQDIWHLVSDAREEIVFHHIGEPVFSPDSKHIAFQASANEDWYIVVDSKQSKGGKYSYDPPVFNANSSKLAYLENIDKDRRKLYITDLNFNSLRIIDSVAAPLVRSPDGNMIAVVIRKNNKQRVAQIAFERPDVVTEGGEYDAVSHLVFSIDGASLAYIAERGKYHYLILDGKEQRINKSGIKQLLVSPNRKGVGIIFGEQKGEMFSQVVPSGIAEKYYDEVSDLTYSKDGVQHAYLARKGENWFVVINGSEGPTFDKIVSPLFSPDGRKFVYRARKDGKRFVVVADSRGKTVRQHPAYEQVFLPVFSPDGKSVAYGVKDANKLVWMVEKL
jgi:Tol biopolymer transport system component